MLRPKTSIVFQALPSRESESTIQIFEFYACFIVAGIMETSVPDSFPS